MICTVYVPGTILLQPQYSLSIKVPCTPTFDGPLIIVNTAFVLSGKYPETCNNACIVPFCVTAGIPGTQSHFRKLCTDKTGAPAVVGLVTGFVRVFPQVSVYVTV